MARITAPWGASPATLRAAANVAPEEMPQKMAWLRARGRALSTASVSVTVTIRWRTSRFRTAGTKSGVQPWILCGAAVGQALHAAQDPGLDAGLRARGPEA